MQGFANAVEHRGEGILRLAQATSNRPDGFPIFIALLYHCSMLRRELLQALLQRNKCAFWRGQVSLQCISDAMHHVIIQDKSGSRLPRPPRHDLITR